MLNKLSIFNKSKNSPFLNLSINLCEWTWTWYKYKVQGELNVIFKQCLNRFFFKHLDDALVMWWNSVDAVDELSVLLMMWQVMAVWCTYFTIEFSWCLEAQSWGYSVNRRGVNTQPWGQLVLSTNVEQSKLSRVCLCGSLLSSCSVFSFSFTVRLCWKLSWS